MRLIRLLTSFSTRRGEEEEPTRRLQAYRNSLQQEQAEQHNARLKLDTAIEESERSCADPNASLFSVARCPRE
jgi:hypothetical protein